MELAEERRLTLALEAVGAALSGGGTEHETVRPLRRGWGWQAHALLRRPGVQPGHWRGLNRQGGVLIVRGIGRQKGEVRTGVDERDEEEEQQRASTYGADPRPRGRHIGAKRRQRSPGTVGG